MIDLYAEIRRRYGDVRRARGYYLYTEKNIRLLDLWLDGGQSILGRKAGQANLMCKQFFDRGLTGFLPTKADRQLERAVSALIPDRPIIRWYESAEKAERIVRAALKKETEEQLPVWRPFLGFDYAEFPRTDRGSAGTGVERTAEEALEPPLFLVTPAYPAPCGIIAAYSGWETAVPPSDPLFPPLVYGLARAFFDVRRIMQKEDRAKKDNEKKRPHTASKKDHAAVCRQAEQLVSVIWHKKSRYLFPHIPKDSYRELFFRALDARILISPYYDTPSVFPETESAGELLHFLKTYIMEVSK